MAADTLAPIISVAYDKSLSSTGRISTTCAISVLRKNKMQIYLHIC